MYYHPIKELLSWQGTKRKPLIFSSNPNFTISTLIETKKFYNLQNIVYIGAFNMRYMFLSSIHTLVVKKTFQEFILLFGREDNLLEKRS